MKIKSKSKTSFHSGHEGIVERLITANADVNVVNEDGSSPLHLAVFGGILNDNPYFLCNMMQPKDSWKE